MYENTFFTVILRLEGLLLGFLPPAWCGSYRAHGFNALIGSFMWEWNINVVFPQRDERRFQVLHSPGRGTLRLFPIKWFCDSVVLLIGVAHT